MRNFQCIDFIWAQIYREIFKSALVYFYELNKHFLLFLVMMMCGWITLTSQRPLENNHKRQQICQIRHEKCRVVHPTFQVCLFYTSWSCDNSWEPIKWLHFMNAWSNRFSFNVYFSANGAKMCGPSGFPLIKKTGWTTCFFHALFDRSAAFCGHFWADTVTSESSTCIPSSHHLFS